MEQRTGSKGLGLVGVSILLVLVMVGAAFGVTSSTFKYNRVKTSYLSLPASIFVVDNDANYNNQWGSGLTSGALDCFAAHVQLPNRAKMKQVVYFFRSGNGGNLYGEITQTSWATGDILTYSPEADILDDQNVYVAKAFGIPPERQEIDNKNFAYAVGICLAADTAFKGARIKYTYQSAGD